MTTTKEQEGIWQKLGSIDRRWIYAVSLILITYPLINPLALPIAISPETVKLYNYIDKLPTDSIVALSMDFDTPISENYPQARSVFTYLLNTGKKVIVMGTWLYGATVTSNTMVNDVKTYAQLKGKSKILQAMETYGENYILLGFITGGATGVMQLAQVGFYPLLFPKDVNGIPLETLSFNKAGKPITEFMASDIDFLISFTAGSPGFGDYVNYWWSTGVMKNLGVGAIGVMLSSFYESMDAGIVKGIIPSTRGAMEFDQLAGLVGAGGQSVGSMDAQSLQHLFIAILLVLGNVSHFAVSKGRRNT
jgi:hypothetical protein